MATALARMAGMLVADQTASLRRYDPDQVLRVASTTGEALSKLLTPLAVVQVFNPGCLFHVETLRFLCHVCAKMVAPKFRLVTSVPLGPAKK